MLAKYWNNHLMLHQNLLFRNNCKEKINYDWLMFEFSKFFTQNLVPKSNLQLHLVFVGRFLRFQVAFKKGNLRLPESTRIVYLKVLSILHYPFFLNLVARFFVKMFLLQMRTFYRDLAGKVFSFRYQFKYKVI